MIESREEVASSNTKIGEPFRIARAMATLCFSPPDNFKPLSPTCGNYITQSISDIWSTKVVYI